MPADLPLVLTYGAIFLLNAFFHSSRVGLTPISRFFRMDAGGIVTIAHQLGAIHVVAYSPCLRIYVTHHDMKRAFTVFQDMLECVHVTQVHIHVRVRREFQHLVLTSMPLIKSGIQLMLSISAVQIKLVSGLLQWQREQP